MSLKINEETLQIVREFNEHCKVIIQDTGNIEHGTFRTSLNILFNGWASRKARRNIQNALGVESKDIQFMRDIVSILDKADAPKELYSGIVSYVECFDRAGKVIKEKASGQNPIISWPKRLNIFKEVNQGHIPT